jgi:hypothetical protein
VALLLPPLCRRQVGGAALDLPGHRERSAAHLEEIPARLDPDVYVDPLRTGGLRIALEAVLGEHVADDERRAPHGVPLDAGRRVEVDAELVGMVEIGTSGRPGVEVDHAKVDRPDEMRGVVGDQLLGGPARRERYGRRLQPIGHLLRHSFLPDRVLHDPVHEPLHHGGPLSDVDQRRVRNRYVVLGESELRPAWFREVDLGRVGESNLTTRHLEHRVLALGH